jgi:hypothetical protein
MGAGASFVNLARWADIDRGAKLRTVHFILTKATRHTEQRDAVCGALLLMLQTSLCPFQTFARYPS